MADPYHHAVSSVKKWGGTIADYLEIHEWFDASKDSMCDFRHRARRHHAEGIAECIDKFGRAITLSSGRVVPVRWIGEQHVLEDLKHIPNFADWARHIHPAPWMGRVAKADKDGVPLPMDVKHERDPDT